MDNRVSPIDEESVSDAVHALDDVPLWELNASRWSAIADILHSLRDAWRDGDAEAFRAATIALELASPGRVTRIGSEPTVPPPPPVLEVANSLVHTLTGDDTESADQPDE